MIYQLIKSILLIIEEIQEVNGLVSRSKPVPLYYHVMESLLEKISSGYFSVGDSIPTEAELQETYKVSRITIRRAIQELVQDGHLTKQQGKGTFVSKKKASQELNLISSWAETMAGLGMHPETRSIKYFEEPASENIAKLLGIQAGKMIYKVERVRYADDEPICLMTNYIIPEAVPNLPQRGLISESLYETLEKEYNLVLVRAEDTVEARAATNNDASLLQIKRGTPLLYTTRVTFTENDKPVEVVITITRADRYSYKIKLYGRKNS